MNDGPVPFPQTSWFTKPLSINQRNKRVFGKVSYPRYPPVTWFGFAQLAFVYLSAACENPIEEHFAPLLRRKNIYLRRALSNHGTNIPDLTSQHHLKSAWLMNKHFWTE